ncbi:MAG: hypothetical protein HGA45_41705 [Chloroflexales bacterium]|nr:hypothetical protein [Chloroflexales bacterium]
MSDDMPTPLPADDASAPAPTLRRICCVAAPRRPSPSLADQLRAAVVWAQILQGARAAREGTEAKPDDV